MMAILITIDSTTLTTNYARALAQPISNSMSVTISKMMPAMKMAQRLTPSCAFRLPVVTMSSMPVTQVAPLGSFSGLDPSSHRVDAFTNHVVIEQ